MPEQPHPASGAAEPRVGAPAPPPLRGRSRILTRRPWIAALALGLVVLLAVGLPLVSSATVNLSDARQPPSLEYWAGTDQSGRDLLIRVAQGLRVSLLVAVLAAAISTVIGLMIGTLAVAFGGWVDAILMRFGDAVAALPHLVLGIVIVAMYPGSLVAIIASIALTHWPTVARMVRAEALAVREAEFVDAARLSGATTGQVITRHLVPAALPQALVAVVLLVPHAVFHESTLSFLGLGLPPTQASLGTLLAQARSDVLLGSWWSLAAPAGALVVTTLAVASLGRWATDRASAPSLAHTHPDTEEAMR